MYMRFRWLLSVNLVVVFLVILLIHQPVFAALTSWIQTNWSDTSYTAATHVNTTTANQLTLATNTNWFDSNWNYRQSVGVTNSSGSTLTNYQIPIFLNTSTLIAAAKMKADCSDLRLTDASGNLLSYWIATSPSANTCGQTATKIWVKISSLPTSGASFYLYYGNSLATSLSDGSNVFLVFADFTVGTSLPTGWTKTDIGTSGTYSVGGSQLSISNTNGEDVWDTIYGATHVYFNTKITGSFVAEALVTSQSNNNDWSKSGLTVQNSVTSGGANGQAFIVVTPNNGVPFQYQSTTGELCTNGSCPTVIAPNINLSSTTGSITFPILLKLTKNASNQVSGYRSTNGVNWTQQGITATPWNISNSQYVTLFITPHNTAATGTATYSFFYLRQYADTEPTVGTPGSEQSTYFSSGVLTSSIFDTGSSSTFGNLSYGATAPASTSVNVKVRSASNSDMSDSTDFSSCSVISSGSSLSTGNCVTNGQRYLQYQVSLATSNNNLTPVFQSLTLQYSPVPTYTLSYSAGADGTLSGNLYQTVNAGASGSVVIAQPDPGFHFAGWSDGLTTSLRSDTNVSQDIGVTANFSINTYSVNYSAASNGYISGSTNQTVNYGGDTTLITAVAAAGYRFTNWSDGLTVNPRQDFNVTTTISVSANFVSTDTSVPLISAVGSTVSATDATITWTTDEPASSQVQYGLVAAFGRSTSESDTASRLTSHQIKLVDLKSCARYYYRVLSRDSQNNSAVSAGLTFTTAGCVVSTVVGGGETSVPLTGGTLEITNNRSLAQLSIPDDYANASADFQINKLSIASLPATPNGMSLAGNNFYDLLAVTQDNEQLASFQKPVTFTLTYGSDTESNYDESSLDVYKFDGTNWLKKNCLLNTDTNTVTCNLTGFSTYALLGNSKDNPTSSVTTSTTGSVSNGSSVSTCTDTPPLFTPDLFQINTSSNSAKLFFTPLADTNTFYISFSENDTAEGNGEQVVLAREGVQSHTIFFLKPNTVYYVKVRGQNGCMPGHWSNSLVFKTDDAVYYKNSSPKLTSKVLTSVSSSPPAIINPSPSFVPLSKPIPLPVKPKISPSKFCFLWWCW